MVYFYKLLFEWRVVSLALTPHLPISIDYIHVGLLFTVFELTLSLKYDKDLHDGDCTFRCRSTRYKIKNEIMK